jgi:hypothetical protein
MEEKAENPEILYHYTNFGALENILNGKQLWLTDYRHTNDSTEGKWYSEMIKKALRSKNYSEKIFDLVEQTLPSLFNLYLASYCKHSNKCSDDGLLSMWRAYGHSGYAIGFDAEAIRALTTDSQSDYMLQLEKVNYYCSNKDIKRFVNGNNEMLDELHDCFGERTLLENALNDEPRPSPSMQLLGACRKMQMTIKHHGFSEENEHRLICTTYKEDSCPIEMVKFGKPRAILTIIPEELIKKIIISPDSEENQLRKEHALKMLLKGLKLNNIEIIKSSIPYIPYHS